MYKAYIVLTQKLLFCTVCITLFSCKDSDYVDHEFHHLIASIEEKQLIAEDCKWFRAYRVKPERIDAELQKTYSGYEGWQKFTSGMSNLKSLFSVLYYLLIQGGNNESL